MLPLSLINKMNLDKGFKTSIKMNFTVKNSDNNSENSLSNSRIVERGFNVQHLAQCNIVP
jgi:hypothetical protein